MTIYKHQIPERQVLSYAYGRKDEIVEKMNQLTLELGVVHGIIDVFEKKVCRYCNGLQTIMKPIVGCEFDGPRQQKCEACDGTGKPQSSEKVVNNA